MRAQLSLEFLVLLSISLGYVAFSLGTADRMGDALLEKSTWLAMEKIMEMLKFASVSRGSFSFSLDSYPGTSFAVWNEGENTVVGGCFGGEMLKLSSSIKSRAGSRPESCEDMPDQGVLNVKNKGVLIVESPVVT